MARGDIIDVKKHLYQSRYKLDIPLNADKVWWGFCVCVRVCVRRVGNVNGFTTLTYVPVYV